MKKHSTALTIRERKMKITVKCHLTCIRMVTTQKRRERKRMAGGRREKGRREGRKTGKEGAREERWKIITKMWRNRNPYTPVMGT